MNKTYPAGLIWEDENISGARIYRAVLLDQFGKNRGEVAARLLFWAEPLYRDREIHAIHDDLLQHLVCGFVERNASQAFASVLKDEWRKVLDFLQRNGWTYMIRHSDDDPEDVKMEKGEDFWDKLNSLEELTKNVTHGLEAIKGEK